MNENEALTYRQLALPELQPDLFRQFSRRQVVTKCWRKIAGEWVVRDVPFIDDWNAAEYAELRRCLINTVSTGGVVYGAFLGGALKGFCSVEPGPLGSAGQYLDLSSIHVSEDCRGRGMGRALFKLASDWARAHGAGKLYISAHSSVESQAFYRAMGCVEAAEYNQAHVAQEPCDCQLECAL